MDIGELKISDSYQTPVGNTGLDVKLGNEAIWFTQVQKAELSASSKANISEHVKHVYRMQELKENPTVRNFQTVQTEEKREISRELDYYNLDMIITIGYCVNLINRNN